MIGRLTMLCFFIFILFAFSAAFSTNEDSPGQIAGIEQIVELENFAIPADPVSSPKHIISLVSGVRVSLDAFCNDSFKIISIDKKIRHLLCLNKTRFLQIKPQLVKLEACHIHAFPTSEEPPSLS